MPPGTHLPPNWEYRLTVFLGATPDTESAKLFDGWATAEGGSATWNPLNTTLRLLGSTNYNSVGVQNYAHPYIGLAATALTLDNGYYRGIVGDLQTGGHTAVQIVQRNAHEFDLWGTGASNLLRVLEA